MYFVGNGGEVRSERPLSIRVQDGGVKELQTPVVRLGMQGRGDWLISESKLWVNWVSDYEEQYLQKNESYLDVSIEHAVIDFLFVFQLSM